MIKFALLKNRFTRDLFLALIVLSIAVISPVVYFSAQARQDISEKIIDSAAERAVNEFRTMADAMTSALILVQEWGASGKIALSDTKGLNGLLFPVLKRDRLLFGISVANTNGNSYYLTADGDGWRTSETKTNGATRQSLVRHWDADQQQISEEKKPTQYDPRQRPWFFPALAKQNIFWTEPYKYYDRSDVGITASVACGQGTETRQMVVAFDILLDDLFQNIHRMAPSENSRVLIVRNDARLYIPESENSPPDFRSMQEVDDQLIQKLHTAWNADHKRERHVFSIRHDNRIWWCGFRPLEISNRNTWVGVTIPETDIVGDISQRRIWLWIAGAVVVLLAGGLAFWLNRRYGRPLTDPAILYDSKRPEESIRRLIEAGEGRSIEFKSTMRMNLHTGKPGKEIEMAWLKAVAAFMNTDGGTLLLGVTDDGEIAGLKRDGFENQDKCKLHFKNLINRHIGPELSKYLRFQIVRMDDKEVGVVVCRRSPEPAYLQTPKNEAFYIRSGPSSDELPVSKVVKYISHRK